LEVKTPLAFAVGVYLPLSSSSPIFIGGIVPFAVLAVLLYLVGREKLLASRAR
jgi:uncharacterized oligopeptide transporter (OPT) family protein